MKIKVKEIFSIINSDLEKISSESKKETNLILDKIFSLNKLDILLNKEIDFNQEKEKLISEIIKKRKQRIPIQYILKEQFFRTHYFYVDERVLIPRPETEILIDQVLNLIENKEEALYLVDIGCGSGCISLSLANELKNSIIYCSDISDDALSVTKINQEKLKLNNNNIKLIKSDKLEYFFNKGIKFDFIISNPPYIPLTDFEKLELEVKKEPRLALTEESDGLSFYRYFAKYSNLLLNDKGYLCCEIGYGQALQIVDILSEYKYFNDIKIIKDYSNIERFVIAKYENLPS